MKSLKKLIAGGLLVFSVFTGLFAAKKDSGVAAFSKGVNLSKWFETWNNSIPNLRVYDRSDFVNLKELGCDVIRVPIHFQNFVDKETGKIDPIIFEYLDNACDWAEELGMYIIIDNHSFNSGTYPTAEKVAESLRNVWPQVAKRYKNRSNYIVYEILNEPQLRNPQWEPIQKEILELIRKTDKKHTVVVTGAEWSTINTMTSLELLNDKNIIYTFHFYEPMIFTHQGADWGERYLQSVKGLPFPYDAEKMPELKKSIPANIVTNYAKRDGFPVTLKNSLKRVADFAEKNNVKVWCGELGVHDVVAPVDSRNNWYKAVGDAMEEFNIAYTVWGYDDTFGIFTKDSMKQYPYDLNKEVLTALRFNVPEAVGTPAPAVETKYPLVLYDDFGAKGVNYVNWSMVGFNTSYKQEPASGPFCIRMNNTDRYGGFRAELNKKDLSGLTGSNGSLSFYVKFTSAEQQFQVRFVDTDDGVGENPPYRFMANIKASDHKLNTWEQVTLKFTDMVDVGAWSNITNTWYDGCGKFDWARVDSLEFAAEEGSIKGEVFLDNIVVNNK